MIGRVFATSGALIPIAAAAAQTNSANAQATVPVVWYFLGEPFEAAAMIAALFGCFAARFWIGAGQQLRKEHRWTIDAPVSAMALAVTATLVMRLQPSPFIGLMIGGGAGVLGEGVFKLAERALLKGMAVAGIDVAPSDLEAVDRAGGALRQAYPPAPTAPDDHAGLLGQLPPDHT